uniref:Uncharacterized protein n=1 Tax=Arundo donax TaxID=35708 RepID=A0A0A9AU98_ARUDO
MSSLLSLPCAWGDTDTTILPVVRVVAAAAQCEAFLTSSIALHFWSRCRPSLAGPARKEAAVSYLTKGRDERLKAGTRKLRQVAVDFHSIAKNWVPLQRRLEHG